MAKFQVNQFVKSDGNGYASYNASMKDSMTSYNQNGRVIDIKEADGITWYQITITGNYFSEACLDFDVKSYMEHIKDIIDKAPGRKIVSCYNTVKEIGASSPITVISSGIAKCEELIVGEYWGKKLLTACSETPVTQTYEAIIDDANTSQAKAHYPAGTHFKCMADAQEHISTGVVTSVTDELIFMGSDKKEGVVFFNDAWAEKIVVRTKEAILREELLEKYKPGVIFKCLVDHKYYKSKGIIDCMDGERYGFKTLMKGEVGYGRVYDDGKYAAIISETDYITEKIREECLEKYKKGIFFICKSDGTKYQSKGTISTVNDMYCSVHVEDGTIGVVYSRGNWADIVIGKTKEEKQKEAGEEALKTYGKGIRFKCVFDGRTYISTGEISSSKELTTGGFDVIVKCQGGGTGLVRRGEKYAEIVPVNPIEEARLKLKEKILAEYKDGTYVKCLVDGKIYKCKGNIVSSEMTLHLLATMGSYDACNVVVYKDERWGEIVTKEEYETDLVKQQVLKKYSKGVKFKCLTANAVRTSAGTIRVVTSSWISIDTEEGGGAIAYNYGTYAEIIPDKTSREKVLEEAIKRYPVGSRVKCLDDGIVYRTTDIPFMLSSDTVFVHGDGPPGTSAIVARNGQFAQIVSDSEEMEIILVRELKNEMYTHPVSRDETPIIVKDQRESQIKSFNH